MFVVNLATIWLFDGDLYLDLFTAGNCCCPAVFEDAKTT